jgi:hypothetical protein
MGCARCEVDPPDDRAPCAWCGSPSVSTVLVHPESKLSRWFFPVPVTQADDPDMVLRVSRYVQEHEIGSVEGTVRVPSGHVRFSLWAQGRAVSVLSLPEDEARELAEFILSTASVEARPLAG